MSIGSYFQRVSLLARRVSQRVSAATKSLFGQGKGGLLAMNTAALTVGRLGSKLLVFLFVRFYTAILTDAQLGTADLITNLANLIIPIACAGLSSGFFRFAAEVRAQGDANRIFNSGLGILALFSAGFALLSPILFLFDYFRPYVWLVVLYVLSANVHYFCSEYIRGRGNYKLFAVQGIINTGANILFNLLLLLPPISLGIEGYVLSVILANIVTTVYIVAREKLWAQITPGAADRATMVSMLRFCLPLIPATICWWITSASDHYMVMYFCGDAANGLYAAAYKIPNLLTICGGIFIEAWQFSAVVENSKKSDEETLLDSIRRKQRVANFFTVIFKGYTGVMFLGAGAMILFSQIFAKILFAPEFYAAWVYIPLLVAATVFSALSSFTASVYLVEKKSNLSLLTAAIGAAVNLLLNFLLIPTAGPMGAAVATLLSYIVVLGIRLYNVRGYIPFRCQPLRLGINTVLIVLQALLVSPVLRNLPLAILVFALIVLNNIFPLLHSVRKWLRKRGLFAKKV